MSPYREHDYGPQGTEESKDGAGLPLGELLISGGIILAIIVSVALFLWGSP
jgi:hypothetical protein